MYHSPLSSLSYSKSIYLFFFLWGCFEGSFLACKAPSHHGPAYSRPYTNMHGRAQNISPQGLVPVVASLWMMVDSLKSGETRRDHRIYWPCPGVLPNWGNVVVMVMHDAALVKVTTCTVQRMLVCYAISVIQLIIVLSINPALPKEFLCKCEVVTCSHLRVNLGKLSRYRWYQSSYFSRSKFNFCY